MNRNKNMKFVRLVAMMLVVVLALPVGVKAAVVEPVQPCASYYLNSYNAYIYTAGSGKIQVYYSVYGVGYMDTIGYMRVAIYESTDNSNWTWVKTFTDTNTPSMMGYNDYYHSGHVDYQGVAGRYYRAYVCVWAGKDGGGDTRYFYTSSKKAT